MNDQRLIEACLTLSYRECTKTGISRRTWEHVRETGELPSEKRGPAFNHALTEAILETVKIHPDWGIARMAWELACSKDKVQRVFDDNGLNHMWQRLRYADVHLKELDPDLLKAREKPIHADGPGALIHIDAKRYGSLQGGILVVGLTVVDNFSGFAHLHLRPDGRKTGENTVAALQEFSYRFPSAFRVLYSDNGSEFVNQTVAKWCDDNGVKHRKTQVGHPWSNGKAERLQAILKRELVIPALLGGFYATVPELQEALESRLAWFNHERPHFGRVNQGLTPYAVASECDGLGKEEREAKLKELRKSVRHRNRSEWERERVRGGTTGCPSDGDFPGTDGSQGEDSAGDDR